MAVDGIDNYVVRAPAVEAFDPGQYVAWIPAFWYWNNGWHLYGYGYWAWDITNGPGAWSSGLWNFFDGGQVGYGQGINLYSNYYWAVTNYVYFYATSQIGPTAGWYTSQADGANSSDSFYCLPH